MLRAVLATGEVGKCGWKLSVLLEVPVHRGRGKISARNESGAMSSKAVPPIAIKSGISGGVGKVNPDMNDQAVAIQWRGPNLSSHSAVKFHSQLK